MAVLTPRRQPSLLSFIIPLLNEEETLPALKERLLKVAGTLACKTEWVFINDGSSDGTEAFLKAWAKNDKRVRLINLSRNFGHQAALTAGLDHALGEAVFFLDGDLQDPPELVLPLISEYQKGYEVVLAKRTERHGERVFKVLTARIFYWIFKKLALTKANVNEGDCCLLSARAAQSLRGMRESHRFMRGLVGWLGYPSTQVLYERPPRKKGKTKFAFLKMFSFAWDAFFSFSLLPLRLATVLGFAFFSVGFLTFLFTLNLTSLILESILGGAILLCLGIMGEYIGRTYEMSKDRPLYLVRELVNFRKETSPQNQYEEILHSQHEPNEVVPWN